MPEMSIESKELDAVLVALRQFPKEVDAVMRPAIRAGAEILRAGIATYPRATAANAPPGINGYSWYERGFGTRTVTGRAYPTSQTLGKSWATAVKRKGLKGWEGSVGTNVGYAPPVQQEGKQASFHRARGWPTDQQVMDKNAEKVLQAVGVGIDAVLAKFGR